MEIFDKIYGKEEIQEPILLELINSSSVQRLKDISQLGVPDIYYYKKGFSRYEHSLGVLILLKKLNASLEEQVAGILHDVSHPVFSHVIDFVLGDPIKEDYQDLNHLKLISKSEIPKILKKYSFDYKKISNLKNFPLLERETPSLCADRIDYCLRELGLEKGFELPTQIFKNLRVIKNQICFKDKKFAELFAINYVGLQNNSWGSDQARLRYYILSAILKKGLDEKLIFLEDLNKTESYVIDILKNSNDKFISENLNLLKTGFKILDSEEGIEIKKKIRYIDPGVCSNGLIKKLSEISEDYKKVLELEKGKSNSTKKLIYLAENGN